MAFRKGPTNSKKRKHRFPRLRCAKGLCQGHHEPAAFRLLRSKVDQLKELTMLALTKTSLQCANPSSQVRFP